MLIFHAGTPQAELRNEYLFQHLDRRLLSYFDMTKSVRKTHLDGDNCPPKEYLILDSGAFSAWSKKAVINFDEYIQFCLTYQDKISYIVNLDVIPASPGQKRISGLEIERSASLGWRNAHKLFTAGIPLSKLIHVFHQNEDFKWLERMVRDFQYIGLSPANDRTTQEKVSWLDRCMNYVTDSNGDAIIKFHGFAVTSHLLMKRYPWYSVDSASWTLVAAMGGVILPDFNEPFQKPHLLFDVSSKSSAIGDLKHINNIAPQLRKRIFSYFQEQGFTSEALQTDYYTRAAANVQYMNNLSAYFKQHPQRFINNYQGFNL